MEEEENKYGKISILKIKKIINCKLAKPSKVIGTYSWIKGNPI